MLTEYIKYLEKNDRLLVYGALNVTHYVTDKVYKAWWMKIYLSGLLTFDWAVTQLQTGSHSPIISVTENADRSVYYIVNYSHLWPCDRPNSNKSFLDFFLKEHHVNWNIFCIWNLYTATTKSVVTLTSAFLHMTVASICGGIMCSSRNILLDYVGFKWHSVQTDVGQQTPENNNYFSSYMSQCNCCQTFKRKGACCGTSVTSYNE